MRTLLSSGDLGDLVQSLAIAKWKYDTEPDDQVIYIQAANYTRQRLTPDKWKVIEPLLLRQPYIHRVEEYKGQHIDVNLNDFRAPMFSSLAVGKGRNINLWQWMCMAHNAPPEIYSRPWLEVDITPKVWGYGTVINRTRRYNNPSFPWIRMIREANDPIFLGLEDEHKALVDYTDMPIHHVPTNNLLQAAEIIAAADLFIGNQSCLYAIAEGLKKPAVLEVFPQMPNCIFNRPDVVHGWDATARLPALAVGVREPDASVFVASPVTAQARPDERQDNSGRHGEIP